MDQGTINRLYSNRPTVLTLFFAFQHFDHTQWLAWTILFSALLARSLYWFYVAGWDPYILGYLTGVGAAGPGGIISDVMYTTLGLLSIKVVLIDTLAVWKTNTPIRHSPFYVSCYTLFACATIFMMVPMVKSLKLWAFGNELKKVIAIFMFGIIMLVVYVVVRTCATRCFAYSRLPLMLFFVHLMSDLLSELIVVDMQMDKPLFWVVIVWDSFLLIMRDADLWEDTSAWVKVNLGGLALRILNIGQIMAGRGDELGEVVSRNFVDNAHSRSETGSKMGRDRALTSVLLADNTISPVMKQLVRRQTAMAGALSEVLASVILISLICAEGVFNMNIVTFASRQTGEKSAQSMAVYWVVLGTQLVALALSHRIIMWKQQRELETGVLMPSGKEFHAFATHRKLKKETEGMAIYVKDQLQATGRSGRCMRTGG